MKKLKEHIRKWNKWRKGNTNGKIHKILVLFGKHSPTFEWVQDNGIAEAMKKGIENAKRENVLNGLQNAKISLKEKSLLEEWDMRAIIDGMMYVIENMEGK